MKREAILHMPLSQYAYALDERTLNIRIRAARNDLRECILFYGNRVDTHPDVRMTRVEMRKTATDDLFDYFEAEIHDEYSRVCYYFLLSDGAEEAYYYGRGFARSMQADRTEYFQFPYIRREDIGGGPDWARDIIMYHIFPDSFASDRKFLCGKPVEHSVKGEFTSSSHLGGTLKGVEANLDHIAGLGVNCIYLNPVFVADSYHKYDTIDYMDVDPCFGTMEDLKRLVRKCHESGIRVILDGVFNHCGSNFFAFQDVLKHGSRSVYHDWFYEMPDEVEFRDPPNYEAFAYVKEMPKLNTGNPEVIDYFCKVGRFWIEEADIDGWRLDVANEVDHNFWRMFRKAVCGLKKDAFLIAEIWEEAAVWLQGDQFDSTMNYSFSNLCKDLIATGKLTVPEFDEQVNRMLMRYSWPTDLCQMNFLDTHDVPRFLSYCGGNREKLKLALAYMMTAPGIPSVFYGDEYCIEGMQECEYRRKMPWDTAPGTDADLTEFVRKLTCIRAEQPALRRGKYETVRASEDGLYIFRRVLGEDSCTVLMNAGKSPLSVVSKEYGIEGRTELLAGEPVSEEIVLAPMTLRIIKA